MKCSRCNKDKPCCDMKATQVYDERNYIVWPILCTECYEIVNRERKGTDADRKPTQNE